MLAAKDGSEDRFVARPETFELLRKVPLFSRLGRPEIERVVERATEIEVPDGQVLTRQGTSGQDFFVVLSGHVIVARDDQQMARLGPGEFLGEIALLDGRPRTASATADGTTRLLVLDHAQFDALLDEFPSITRQVVQALVVVFAIIRAVRAADLRSIGVVAAAMVGLQVLAIAIHAQIPGSILDIGRDVPVHHEPAQIVEVLAGCRRIDGNREIPAAQGRAIRAQHFARFQLVAFDGELRHGAVV
jgi:CRP-like cAMP-binding protein